ncbi:MAG: PHB depolymerase family esterase [Candidatus Omnitrophota bacterium]
MKKITLIAVLLTAPLVCFAETIMLKSGKEIAGKIIEDTETYIEVETADGESVYYNKNLIKNIITDKISSLQSDSSQASLKTGLIDRSKSGYMLFIPKDTSSAQPTPFLICLPGWGISAKQDINNWAFYAGRKGFIVVDLDIDYSRIRSNSDVDKLYSKISNIILSLAEEYPASKNKVYIAGTSAGGMMSMALSLRNPDKFFAIGVISGGRLSFGAENNLNSARGQWFYMVHGRKDESIRISEFNLTKKKLERNGAIIEYKVVPEGTHTLPSGAYQEVVNWLSKAK